MNWNSTFASRTALMQRSTVRDLLKLTTQPGMISFAGGLPAPELLPIEELAQAMATALAKHGTHALQYGETEGIAELRDWIAARFSRPHFQVRRENVLIVTGSQQALDLIGKVFLNARDCILVENPTYLAALLAWRPAGVAFAPVPSDAEGMRVDELTTAAAQAAKLLYVVPNFQNPQGTTLTLDQRQLLLKKSRATGLPVIEDNPYGELRYRGEALPHLLELDAQCGPAGELQTNVIHLGTFSKVLAPGLRVGWVIAPSEVIEKLVQAKQAADLHTSTLCQYIALEMVDSGVLDRQIPKLRDAYRIRRDAMLSALRSHMPPDVTWSQPDGGMFLLATLPEQLDAAIALERAVKERVAFVPGAGFHVDGSGHNTLRLNFSNQPPARIGEGIARLGAVVAEMIHEPVG